MKCSLYLHGSPGRLWDAIFILSSDNPTGQRGPRDHTNTCDETMTSEESQMIRFGGRIETYNTPTYFVVDLWKLSFHFLPLEEMILSLLAHRRNQIKLPGHRIRFLIKWWKEEWRMVENVQEIRKLNADLYFNNFCLFPTTFQHSNLFSVHFNWTQCHLLMSKNTWLIEK